MCVVLCFYVVYRCGLSLRVVSCVLLVICELVFVVHCLIVVGASRVLCCLLFAGNRCLLLDVMYCLLCVACCLLRVLRFVVCGVLRVERCVCYLFVVD